MAAHYGFAISWHAPGAPFRWKGSPVVPDLLARNGYALPYVVLAEGLSKVDARIGQDRVFDYFGIGPESFLLNTSRR
jgi:hypothetical protein